MVVAYFEPGFGALGGALIGASAAVLLLLGGEIMGASSVCSTIFLHPVQALTNPADAWRLFLLAIFMLLSNTVLGYYFTTDTRLVEDPSIPFISMVGFLIGGFMVGFGTRLANGCTTGHGICGMARLSKRSFAAVAVFMGGAVGTANLVSPDNTACARYTAFLRTDEPYELFNRWIGVAVTAPIVLASLFALYNLRKAYLSIRGTLGDEKVEGQKTDRNGEDEESGASNEGDAADEDGTFQKIAEVCGRRTPETSQPITAESLEVEPKFTENKKVPNQNERRNILDGVSKINPAALSGILFASGLALSGMTLPSKIMGFLNLFLLEKKTWDPTLMMVMAGGAVISWISYQFVSGHGIIKWSYTMECPSRSSTFSIPKKKNIDVNLVVGSFCFGIGWGVSGLCPGPAMFLAATGTVPIIAFWWPTFILGSLIAQKIKDRYE